MARSKKVVPYQKALELAAEYSIEYSNKRAIDDKLKRIKAELQVYAEENPGDFQGQKSLDLETVKIAFKTKTDIKKMQVFNPSEFLNAYPAACDVKVKPSKVENIDLDMWGLEKVESETFAVDVKK